MRVLSTLAVKGVLTELLETDAVGAARVDVLYEPTAMLMERIRLGEQGDIVILTSTGVDELIAAGTLQARSKRDVAISAVGIAVRAGAVKPDISTPEAVRALLRRVPTLCFSRSGASGLHFARVIRQLGIADEIEAKATIIANGFTAETVADGRCEIAVQQISELLVVPGIEVIGPLPHAIQETLTFSAGIFAASTHAQAATAWLGEIRRPSLAAAYMRHGLTLARS